MAYEPFGAVHSSTEPDRITYADEAVVSLTGRVHLSARYMDPSTGRSYALDPELGYLSAPQTLNRYVYCANNPLIFTDPSGCDFFGDAWNFLCDNREIIVVAVCVGLTVATAGIASPALALVASMAIGAGTSALDYGLTAGSSFSWEGLATNMVIGAATGAVHQLSYATRMRAQCTTSSDHSFRGSHPSWQGALMELHNSPYPIKGRGAGILYPVTVLSTNTRMVLRPDQ